jgi:hypothetical protein
LCHLNQHELHLTPQILVPRHSHLLPGYRALQVFCFSCRENVTWSIACPWDGRERDHQLAWGYQFVELPCFNRGNDLRDELVITMPFSRSCFTRLSSRLFTLLFLSLVLSCPIISAWIGEPDGLLCSLSSSRRVEWARNGTEEKED